MADVVRSALVQASWTGDKESMIKVHEEHARTAASQGVQVICFQELFYGPYFCQVQDAAYYEYAESVPGPTVERFQAIAAETGMVMVLPVYEQEQPGVLYNTAAVVDADGTYLGKYRKTHIPQVKGFWEKFYFRPGNLGYPVFDTAVGPVGVYICYDRHFPEGWRALGLGGARIVFNPSATSRGLSMYLWNLEQPAAGGRQRVLRRGDQPGGRRGPGRQRLLRVELLRRPPGAARGRGGASDGADELVVRDLDMAVLAETREQWQFYRDRRPVHVRLDHRGLTTRRGRSGGEAMTTLITGGTVVSPEGATPMDVVVEGETIAALVPPGSALVESAAATAERHIDATGMYVIPGGVDVHTHMELPFGGTNAVRHVRDRHPGRGVGRHHDHHRLRRAAHRRAGHGRARGLARQGRGRVRHRLRLPHDPGRGRRRLARRPWTPWSSARASPASSCSWPTRASSTATTARSCRRCRRRRRTARW